MLELTESVTPEEKKLRVDPLFDQPAIQITLNEDGDPFIQLNPRQIECLVDFLNAWLKRLPARGMPTEPTKSG